MRNEEGGADAPQDYALIGDLQTAALVGRGGSIDWQLAVRPDYASIQPWVELSPDGATATAGPDAFGLSTSLPLSVEDGIVRAEFEVVEGARERLSLTRHLSYAPASMIEDADSALVHTEAWWRRWSDRCRY